MVAALQGKIAASVQIAQRPAGMGLQIQSAGNRQVLPGDCQQIGQDASCTWAVALMVDWSSKACRRRLMRCACS